ncbi:phage baseplate upper protein, partial [Enterococcus gallinarum]
MAIKYPITLSTTEPNNNIGLLKIRQADEETQMLVVQILEDAIPKSYDGLQVFFCARIGQTPGLGIIEQKLTEDEMTDPKKGKLEYTFRSEDWQVLGRQTGYFSFRKMVDDHTYEQQFSTRDFNYEVIKNIYSDGIREVTKDGSTYVWTIEDLIRLFNEYIATGKTDWEEFVEQNKEIIESVDPGGTVLSELIRSRKPAGATTSYPDLPTRLDEQIGKNEEFRDFESANSFMKRVNNEFSERALNS